MSDIQTIWSPTQGIGDWYLTPVVDAVVTDENGGSVFDELGAPINDGILIGGGDLLAGNDLGSAILISLFTDATAAGDDVIPDASGDARGWWGDLDQAYPIGSKIWLRMRSKQTDLTLALVKDDVRSALQWLIDDGVAASVEVATEWTRPGMLGCQLAVTRANGSTASVEFAWAWQEIA